MQLAIWVLEIFCFGLGLLVGVFETRRYYRSHQQNCRFCRSDHEKQLHDVLLRQYPE